MEGHRLRRALERQVAGGRGGDLLAVGRDGPSSIGWVSLNVEVGNCDVFMIRPLNWPSRWLLSLVTVVMSTVKLPSFTERAADGEAAGDAVRAADGLGRLAEQGLLHAVADLRRVDGVPGAVDPGWLRAARCGSWPWWSRRPVRRGGGGRAGRAGRGRRAVQVLERERLGRVSLDDLDVEPAPPDDQHDERDDGAEGPLPPVLPHAAPAWSINLPRGLASAGRSLGAVAADRRPAYCSATTSWSAARRAAPRSRRSVGRSRGWRS